MPPRKPTEDTTLHKSPCATMKALLGLGAIFIVVAGLWGGMIQASVNEVRAETAKTLTTLSVKIERIDAEGRAGTIATSRIEEQLKAVRESLLRIERELERRDTPPK